MYCAKNKCIQSVNDCIKRREKAQLLSKEKKSINSFQKCLKCEHGKLVAELHHPLMDADIRKIYREYLPKFEKKTLLNKKIIQKKLNFFLPVEEKEKKLNESLRKNNIACL